MWQFFFDWAGERPNGCDLTDFAAVELRDAAGNVLSRDSSELSCEAELGP